MCGIAGIIKQSESRDSLVGFVSQMVASLKHRGPDDNGVWASGDAPVALGHARLSILDLSSLGHQPMLSPSGRFVIAFNGEIYNHHALKREIAQEANIVWRGHSDTEVVVAGFDVWGVKETLTKLNGMFAISVFDQQKRQLFLARDRMGEKPLYFGNQRGGVVFASELKAIKSLGFGLEINRDSLCLYFRHNYIPAPYSIYNDIYKLLPGHLLTINCDRISKVNPEMAEPFWNIREIVSSSANKKLEISDNEAVDLLEQKLVDSISTRMESDVPLGAFLSGGYDSSVVTAIMQAQSSKSVKTFSIGFNEESYNEANYAKMVAKSLGTDHTELYISQEEAMQVVPKLPSIYCEPFSDSSQIPTYLVSSLARESVSVALSGDGGDELFTGYSRYLLGQALWKRISKYPSALRNVTTSMIHGVSPDCWDKLFSAVSTVLPQKYRYTQFGDKLHKLANTLNLQSPDALYKTLVSHWPRPEELVYGSREPLTALTDVSRHADLESFVERMMYLDQISYLPDDILTKVDRASMAVSLETRVPLLDHELVEFAWSLPESFKVRGDVGKWVLREVLHRYVPKEIMDRPKMGFGIPIDQWLRGGLKNWAEHLLNEPLLVEQGYLNAKLISEKWEEHKSGKRNWAYHLWDVLMFQAWLAEQ